MSEIVERTREDRFEELWARSSWGCACGEPDGTDAETTRSSWGGFSWASRWEY
jgi:hypothetical protein